MGSSTITKWLIKVTGIYVINDLLFERLVHHNLMNTTLSQCFICKPYIHSLEIVRKPPTLGIIDPAILSISIFLSLLLLDNHFH